MNAAAEAGTTYVALTPGDPAPWFRQRISAQESYSIDKSGGSYVVLCFFITAGDSIGRSAYDAAAANQQSLASKNLTFFGVSMDQADETTGRVREGGKGPAVFWDFDASVSRLYGAAPREAQVVVGNIAVRRFWMVLDPMLRVLKILPMTANPGHITEVMTYLNTLPPAGRAAGIEVQAPVLLLPNVFEPELCRSLITLYEKQGGTPSGFMREIDGKTVVVTDPKHKRRKDCTIENEAVLAIAKQRIVRRIVPEIAKAYQFHVTRIERFIVACYSAEDGGLFNPHRDNTTKGTAHRRFAVSLNLNDDYEGGEIRFPEFSPKGIKPPAGGAGVFSCSLLHAANEVTRGNRYVFLPFLYDEAASKIREANSQYLDPTLGRYKSS